MTPDDLAPWEEGSARKAAAPAQPAAPKPAFTGKVDQLPEIYRPDDSGFLAPGTSFVARPGATPRRPEPRGRTALMALGGGAVAGLLGLVLVFVMFGADMGVIRYIYAAFPAILLLVSVAVLVAELPRLSIYRTASFIPGVLVYGTRDQFTKAAGPAGVNNVQANMASGSGRGLLSLVFDRAAHVASPPDVVALHCDRGAGPELVGITWDSVRELRRGDIVWFHMNSPTSFVMFHKLIPFAPHVSTDKSTREEVFRALRVGEPIFKDNASGRNMGTKKVLATDRDGRIATKEVEPESSDPLPAVPLSAPGAMLGSSEQPTQEVALPPKQRDTEVGIRPGDLRLRAPGASLGGVDQPKQGPE